MAMESLRFLKIAANYSESELGHRPHVTGVEFEQCPWLGLSLFEDLWQASAWLCLCSTYVFVSGI